MKAMFHWARKNDIIKNIPNIDAISRGKVNHQDRFIYFQYHAIRDEKGNYLGALERIQDATRLREIQGEKRLISNSE